ncbi:MAG: SGNH/GDSL hydrolase family protein [Verrucomicrobiales bacterium]|nr:SGNH/GDSL hydrolase family protein [Verrucomicrobiales bacterium]
MKTLFVLLLLLVSGVSANAQSTAPGEKPAVEKKAPHPSFAEIEDVEGLPRALILGDSISMGYTLPVRAALKGEANVHRPAANCGPTDSGLKYIDAWLGEGKWDVIHFNWGLHDVMHYLNSVAKEDRVPHTTEGAFRRNSPEAYEKKLRELVSRLQGTGATLIWASTTPIPESSKGLWKPGDSALYNKVAAKVMEENGIVVDDLWSFAKPKLTEIQKERDVHFSPEGSAVLGSEVARVIREALKVR